MDGAEVSEGLDRTFWEDRWEQAQRADSALRNGSPNPQLVVEAGELTPGVALDAGCGQGADAIWLASRGWRVTAVDFAITALRRAREYAGTLGGDIASRIDWVQADLTGWTPTEEHFDLVSAHYLHGIVPRHG
jgi:2-polyprenyl-3-methyl-5-hydroxy-6-metoxy-1,4-benzoquinol methylase